MDKKYVKMIDLVDQDITVQSIGLAKYVKYDGESNKFISEPSWFRGSSKKYPITTDKGIVDMSATNVGNMLEGVMWGGRANIIGATFGVKSNGQTGKEVRYFINAKNVTTEPHPTQNLNNQDLNSGWNDEPLPPYEG